MGRIRILDDDTISKIAAGEVVERPASVVKELIENSIDAGSKNIYVEIQDGGISYIKITDDGSGIDYDDVEIAFLRHATSKISSDEDLFNIRTLGFRGEALASICAVSKVELITRTKENDLGVFIRVEGGEIIEKKECGAPLGTTIIVRDLFYNTPARLKFLKSPGREGTIITEIIQNLAFSNSSISFKYKNGDKLIFATKGDDNLKNTMLSIYGKQVNDNLLEVNYDDGSVSINGYIGNNALAKNSRNYQSLFVNNRYVKNKTINAAIENAFRTFTTGDKFPMYVLHINVEPSIIDVNVHPTKAEIKFQNEQEMYKIVFDSIKKAFSTTKTIPNIIFEPNVVSKSPLTANQERIDFAINEKRDYNIPDDSSKEYKYINSDFSFNEESSLDDLKKEKEEIIITGSNVENKLPRLAVVGQIHFMYIIAEGEEDMFIIDQHAAHERVLYEKYLSEFSDAKIQSQTLLTPIIVELSSTEKNIVVENLDNFAKIGFGIEDFGGNTVSIRAVPVILGNPNYKELIFDIITEIQEVSGNFYKSINKIIYTMACKSAIKAGDRLTIAEMNKLIEDLRRCSNPFACPHGRPAIIKMSYNELERKFRRIL
ncbi:DNA mismatch repair protein MutL [Caloramator mitchellensis]|uniref:DNA mismatch repair protein MutL n=1 Tax=Caloramator mitchellensis TaxID=908809 RepID=A0A0R3JU29_CALMK|nr:DNA mismatch repair endonuclease MutL [Caloramator mitchellensis]KRQ87025.1 DNA mismatch repair protein MutL [Caloramator mitchellensis]